jgi:hypothetical protein
MLQEQVERELKELLNKYGCILVPFVNFNGFDVKAGVQIMPKSTFVKHSKMKQDIVGGD